MKFYNKPEFTWTMNILMPILFSVESAWRHNLEAAAAWLFCLLWVVIAGMKTFIAWMDEDAA